VKSDLRDIPDIGMLKLLCDSFMIFED
jgi:hypothetical protein